MIGQSQPVHVVRNVRQEEVMLARLLALLWCDAPFTAYAQADSEPLLVAHTILLEISCCRSFIFQTSFPMVQLFCVFVLVLYVPVNNFSVISGRVPVLNHYGAEDKEYFSMTRHSVSGGRPTSDSSTPGLTLYQLCHFVS